MAGIRVKSSRTRCTILLILLLIGGDAAYADAFEDSVSALNTRSFDDKLVAAQVLGALDDDRVEAVLSALIDGKLYIERRTEFVVYAQRLDSGGYQLTDVISGEDLAEVGRRGAKKISVNNKLRRQLRSILAGRQLNHPDSEVREAAVLAIVDAGDIALRPLLTERVSREEDDGVRRALALADVVFALTEANNEMLLKAIAASESYLHPAVRTRLTLLRDSEEQPSDVRAAATQALTTLVDRQSRYQLVETLFFGMSLGSILALAAIGLSITFGIMGVINMAHGELMMLGAYTTYVVQLLMPDAIEYSLFVALPAAFLVSGLVGVGIERGVVRFLYGRPLETLLATFGVSLILQQAVRSIFSPLNRSVLSPDWMSGSWEIAQGLSITYNRLYIFFFALTVFAALLTLLQRTRLGLEVRAVTQNRQMARAMGIRSTRVDMLAFGLGSGIAGVAGVALSQLTNVGPNLGQGYIVDSFMVVVFGGVGNLWGTLVGGLSLGVVNKILEPAAGAVVAKILVLIFIIFFIQRRPQGLFPQKGRAAEG